VKREKLIGKAAIKGTVLLSHLAWLDEKKGDHRRCLEPVLDAATFELVCSVQLATWIPLRTLINVDKAIATAVAEPPERVSVELGRHSARMNLGGLYKQFVPDEPHRFFVGVTLHNTFQDFGHVDYKELGSRAGRIQLSQYPEYSPIYCASALGFYEEALKVMNAPGPVAIHESKCQCAGDPACVFDMSW